MDVDNFRELMCSYGEQIDIKFNDKQLSQFYEYMDLLLERNEKSLWLLKDYLLDCKK